MKTNLQKMKSGDSVAGVVESATGFVGSEKLLEILFPDKNSRPTRRWLEMQRKARRVPWVSLGRLVFFDPNKVREALNRQRTASFGVVR
jgi:hypothetical protein